MDTSYKDWLRGLQAWLFKSLLPLATSDRDVMIKCLEKDKMAIWARAFTNSTADDTYDMSNNYERYEVLGDAYSSFAAVKFFMDKYPTMDEQGLSEMKSHYTSGPIQEEILSKIGAGNYVRIGDGVGISNFEILSDLFESIMAALYLVMEGVKRGYGDQACYSFFVSLYKDYPFDLTFAEGDYSTQVDQIFSRFYQTKGVRKTIEESQYHVKVVLELRPEHYVLMKKHGIEGRPPQLIGTGEGEDKQTASGIAYKQAYDLLSSYGVTTRWSKWAKTQEDLSLPDIQPYVQKAVDRLISEGFADLEFINYKKLSATRKVIGLVGIREDGTRKLLKTAEGGQDTLRQKAVLLQMYGEYSPRSFYSLFESR